MPVPERSDATLTGEQASKKEGEGGAVSLKGGSVGARAGEGPSKRFGVRDAHALATVGLFVLGVGYTIFVARDFLLPVTAAFFLKLVLAPVVRKLRHVGIPEAVGGAIVLATTLLAVAWAAWSLSGPANDWLERAPTVLRDVEIQLRGLKESVQSVSRAAEQVEKMADVDGRTNTAVEVRGPTLASLLFLSTRNFVAIAVATVVLLYLLLASGDLFLLKAMTVVPRLEDKVRAVDISRELELKISGYLRTVCAINVGLGAVIALATYLFGMPNPLLWGMMVALFNFVPYLGALASLTILFLAAFVTFGELGRALLVGGLFFGVNALEAYVITPTLLGQRMQTNPVAIFVAMIFFGWAWGVYGLLFAVPILTTFKLLCDHIPPLAPVGELLSA